VGEAALALLHNRLQLLSVELQEEKYRVLQALLWLAGGIILVFLGLAIGVGTLAMVVYGLWGVPGLAGFTVLLLLLGVIVLAVMWHRLKSAGTPFSGTLTELKKDSEWLRRKP
jgi:uncharacterized membrane protein YqjE